MADFPYSPSDLKDLIPSSNESFCSKVRKLLKTGVALYKIVLWGVTEDKLPSEDFVAWLQAALVTGGGEETVPAPVLTNILQDDTGITLSWTVIANAVSYVLYRGTTDDFSASASILSGITVNQHKDTPSSDVIYFYWVIAVDGNDVNSSASNSAQGIRASAAPAEYNSNSTGQATIGAEIPSGTTAVTVKVWGGGGSGGGNGATFQPFGTNRGAGGGGGSGGYSTALFSGLSDGDIISWVIPPAAAGGAPANAGSQGGDSAVTITTGGGPYDISALGGGQGGTLGSGGVAAVAGSQTGGTSVTLSPGNAASGQTSGSPPTLSTFNPSSGDGGDGADGGTEAAIYGAHGIAGGIELSW